MQIAQNSHSLDLKILPQLSKVFSFRQDSWKFFSWLFPNTMYKPFSAARVHSVNLNTGLCLKNCVVSEHFSSFIQVIIGIVIFIRHVPPSSAAYRPITATANKALSSRCVSSSTWPLSNISVYPCVFDKLQFSFIEKVWIAQLLLSTLTPPAELKAVCSSEMRQACLPHIQSSNFLFQLWNRPSCAMTEECGGMARGAYQQRKPGRIIAAGAHRLQMPRG